LGGIIMRDGISTTSPAMSLAHEMGHAAQELDGEINGKTRGEIEEANLKKYETPIAKQLGEPTRATYNDGRGKRKMNNSTHFITVRKGKWLFIEYITEKIQHNQWPIAETQLRRGL